MYLINGLIINYYELNNFNVITIIIITMNYKTINIINNIKYKYNY